MNRIKRNIVSRNCLILSILCSLLLLTNCGKDTATSPNTIKFWHFWSEPNQKGALKELIEKFEVANNCKVELTELSWNDGKTKLIAAFNTMNSGSNTAAPDVIELGSDWVAQFSSTGVLAELNKDSMGYDNFLDYSIPPTMYDNKFYAVPWIVDTRVMFYNKELMHNAGLQEIAPRTYTELLTYSNKINLPNSGIYGFGANGSDPHRLYKKILPMIWTYGGDIFDNNFIPTINSTKNTEALNTYLQLSRVGMIETQRQIDAMFTQGKIGFVFSGAWLLEKIRNENPALQFGVASIPTVDTTSKIGGISFLGCEYLAISKNSEKKDLAIKLIKYLSDGNNALELSKRFAEAGFPADKHYFNNEYFMQDTMKQVFAHQLAHSKATPVHPQWLEIETILEDAVSKALYGEADAFGSLNNAQVEVLKLLSK
ncbi:MAG: extracellular solute-binding protein [Ignavibacteria bacterium]|nr:extracellular solute-binding protein [Ignavibacteria bacterium]